MKLKKGIRKSGRIILIAAIVILIVGIGLLVYKRFFAEQKTTPKAEVVDKLDDYGYYLEDDATELSKKLFKELKKVLNADEVDEEQYATLVAEMLVADFYNLDNKLSKNDIGGVQFIKETYQTNFVLEASETIYKYIEHNLYGDRKQELPKVTNVSLKTMTNTTYKYEDITDDNVYKALIEVSYEKDLGYPTEVTVVMIHNDKKLEVIKMY